jgi:hypothetical protein
MNYPDSYRTLSSIERQATWNKIQGSISHSTEFSPSPYSGSSSLVKKPLLSRDYAIAFLCVLLLSSTTSVAAAADQSLPTSALYAIKLNITEPVRTLTKTTPESRIDWEIERTERRLDETRQLIEQSTLTPEIAREISHQIEKHTDEAQKRIADLSITDSNQGTLLSLSLVETIEKKKEEIIISTEHNLMPDTPAPESVNLSNSETTSDADTTHTELLDPTTDGPTRLSQTESILAILTTADQAQASTDTLIQTISEQAPTPALAINTDSTQQEPEPVPPATDPNVVIFTLVLSDVKNQISKLHTALGTDETVSNPSQLPTVEPTQPQESIDPDAPPSVLPPDTTAVPPLQDTIPEPSTDIEPPTT